MSTTNFSNEPGPAPRGSNDLPGGPSGDSSGVKDQAQQTAGAAAGEGKRVAGVAQDEVKNVTAEAQHQIRGLLNEATTQLDDQSKAQKTRLADTVRTFGDDLQAMTAQDESNGVAAQVVKQVSEQARGLASHLDGREPRELLDDARNFARRRPGTFLLGALAAGVLVGRVTRGAKAAQDGTAGTARTSNSSAAPSTPRGTFPAASGGDLPLPADAYSAGSDLGSGVGPAGGADMPGTRTGAGPGPVPNQPDLGARGAEISESGLPGTRGGGA